MPSPMVSLRVGTPRGSLRTPVVTPSVPLVAPSRWESMAAGGGSASVANSSSLAPPMRDAVTPPQWRTRVCINSVTGQPGSPQVKLAIAAATAAATAALSPPPASAAALSGSYASAAPNGHAGANSRFTLQGPGRYNSGALRSGSLTQRMSIGTPRGSFRAPISAVRPVPGPARSQSVSRADSPVPPTRADSVTSQLLSSRGDAVGVSYRQVTPRRSMGRAPMLAPSATVVQSAQAERCHSVTRSVTPPITAPVARFQLANANAAVQFKYFRT